jgi:GntR family transcriptional regulator
VNQPRYLELADRLRTLARTKYSPGDQFLPEREVAVRFNISRPTANKILSALVSEGVLEFRKGLGTFVRIPSLGNDLRALVSFTEKARGSGLDPSTRVLACRKLRTAPEVGGILGLGPFLYLERLRLANLSPLILERRWIRAALCPGLTRKEAAGSIYQTFISRHALSIGGADQSIRAIAISPEDASLLGVPAGVAGLLIVATGFLSTGEPLWHERTLYRGDAYEFLNRLGANTPPQPAVGRFTGIPESPRKDKS